MISRISLRKIKLSDKIYFAKWWWDKELLKLTSGRLKLISDKEVDKYFETMFKKDGSYDYMVILGKNSVIGHINLRKRRNDWYETQIVIGEKNFWNKGYGTKAIKLIIEKAKRLGIYKIYLEVRPTNKRAIGAYKKCGFQKAEFRKYPKNKYLPLTLRMELKIKKSR